MTEYYEIIDSQTGKCIQIPIYDVVKYDYEYVDEARCHVINVIYKTEIYDSDVYTLNHGYVKQN